MKHLNASGSSRFLAYMLDYTIISFVTEIILSYIIYPIAKIDINLLAQKMQIFTENMAVGVLDYELVNQILTLALIQIGFTTAVMIPLVIGYLCILPYYWEKQTIGRMVAHLKVVNYKDEGKVSFPKLLLRELVGGYLLTYVLCSSFMIPLIIVIYMSTTTGRSLADKVGGTRLINLRFVISEEGHFDFFSSHEQNSDYVDAKFTDVNEEVVEEQPVNNNSDDDYMVI